MFRKWHHGSAFILAGLLWWLAGQPVLAQETAHRVLRGESLSQIAADHDTDLATLLTLNDLENIDVIWVGMLLELPSPSDSARANSMLDDTDELASLTTESIYPRREVPVQSPVSQINNDEPVSDSESSSTPDDREVTIDEVISDTEIIHIVARGEHLGTLEREYGVSSAVIARANNLENANIIVPGQRLIIPLGDTTQQTTTSAQDFEISESSVAPAQSYHVHSELPNGVTGSREKWIDVDLSEQRVVAYVGLEAIETFIVSTGLPGTPTVQGEFRIWAKTPLQDMYGGNRAAGDYYYLEDVPWVQYFFEDYAFHGANWHNNFGQPMSRGCVNMRVEDAQWLFEWASPSMDLDASGWLFTGAEEVGTLVVVHE